MFKKILYFLLGSAFFAGAALALTAPGGQENTYKSNDLLTATTTQATSTPLLVSGAEKVEFYFTRNGASASVATSTFSIQVSPDGTNWYDYNKLISNVTNTNSQELTRVASVEAVGATSTTMVALDLEHDTFHAVRCIAANASTTLETTDSNTCTYSLEN